MGLRSKGSVRVTETYTVLPVTAGTAPTAPGGWFETRSMMKLPLVVLYLPPTTGRFRSCAKTLAGWDMSFCVPAPWCGVG